MFNHITRNLFPELLHKEGPLRSGTHQTHVAFQNIEELGQLVNACFSDDLTHFGNAGIIGYSPCAPLLLGRLDIHGTEFVHFKCMVMQSHPLLGVDQGSR